MGAYVYMLRCADESLLRGERDRKRSVASRRPVDLVWSEHFDRITDAIAVERQLKGWSRAKKEALIGGEWRRIQLLARRRAGK